METSYRLRCSRCGAEAEPTPWNRCLRCGGLLEYAFDPDYLKEVKLKGPITFWRYRPLLPRVDRAISLGEGGTPLHRAERLGEALRLKNLMLKDETRNPTNSFKDRPGALLVSDAYSRGFDAIICATNGNQGASLAAYSAKVDIECHLLIPRDVDMGKLAQMIAYDAYIEEQCSSIEEAIRLSVEMVERHGWYQATAELNPLTIEALKTISYELQEQKAEADVVVAAMGSGATIHSLWKGYGEMRAMDWVEDPPRLIGVQAEGCPPITKAFRLGLEKPMELEEAFTGATPIRVASPIYGELALKAIRESGGLAVSISDEEMLEMEKTIARLEGVFAEPASAATVASLKILLDSGEIDGHDRVVCLIASSGLKTDDILRGLRMRRRHPGLTSRLTTKERILRLMEEGETYGYELWKKLGRGMTLGAVYQHISYLEERGLIASRLKGKRRYLRLTEKGRKVLRALEELRDLLS